MPEEKLPRRTPLYDEHLKRGAKIIDFGGWQMPVQYSSIIDEHNAVRNALGVFDISHMGQIVVRGPEALPWLNSILSNNVERIAPGECQYTFLLNEKGGVIDDLLVYQPRENEYLLVVNAALTDRDLAWMRQHQRGTVQIENRSADYAGLAIQGPKSLRLFDTFFAGKYSHPARNAVQEIACNDFRFLISRTGYTGEDGFEIFFPSDRASLVWNRVFEEGGEYGIKPCGLGARDTLRLEMCYPLNGADLSPDHTPLEAGLSIFVDLNKDDFIGKDALIAQRENGVPRRLVPFTMKEKSPPPRPHYPIFHGENRIGEIASGSLSPSLNTGIGLAYVPAEFARIGEEIGVEIRGRRYKAEIRKKPLHKP